MHTNTQKGIAPIAAIIIALLVIGGGGYGIKKIADKRQAQREEEKQTQMQQKKKADKEQTEKREEADIGRAIHIKLAEQNKSGQKGEATITQTGTSTLKVIVSITGKPSSVAQPAHIHAGSCPNVGAVKYPLTIVTKGASQTEIPNLTLQELLSELPLAINVHKSAPEIKIYTSCGNIEKKEMMSKKDEEKERTDNLTPVAGTAVTYGASGFPPKSVTAKKGDTVTWKNESGREMWVASNEHPTHTLYDGTSLKQHCATGATPSFDQCGRGDTFSFTVTKVGSFGYHNHRKPSDGGTIIVTE